MSWSLFITCPRDRQELLSAELWDRGAIGIIEEDVPGGSVQLRVFFDTRDETISGQFGGDWRQEQDRDWVQAWSEAWKPILLGERLFLIPDWLDEPTPPGRVRIETHPGRAYGTGAGEATQLALLGLEHHLHPGHTVLDVGTGTGILSVAAVALGAGAVIACDIDIDTVEVADANIHRDEIAVHLFAGSVRAIRTESIDTVVANINATTIGFLAADLRRVLKPAGRLITSGFLEGDADGVREVLRPLREIEKLTQNGWVSLTFLRE